MQTETGRVALVAGANGMVGVQLLRALVDAGAHRRIVALTRRPLPLEAPRLVNRIIRFQDLDAELRGVACDDAFCCLGTTRRAAGSRAAFRAIDHDLVLRFASWVQGAGAQTMVCITSAGAAPESRNFYLRVKGETELELEALRFRSLHLMRPGLILGERAQWRTTEMVGRVFMPLINPLLLGRLEQWRAIRATTLASAMRAAAALGLAGVHRHSSRALQALARTGRLPPRV
jgi:uncharacterized protein YbjT (DUF2867 family)